MRPFPWHSILLAASLILALSFALAGWALGRWHSLKHTNLPKAASASSEPKVVPNSVPVPNASGAIVLEPSNAVLHGSITRSIIADEGAIVGWTSGKDAATWQFRANKAGFYSAECTYATADSAADAELELRVDDRKRLCSLRASGGLERFITDEYQVAVTNSGLHQLTIQPHNEIHGPWLVLRSIRLIPTTPDKPGSSR